MLVPKRVTLYGDDDLLATTCEEEEHGKYCRASEAFAAIAERDAKIAELETKNKHMTNEPDYPNYAQLKMVSERNYRILVSVDQNDNVFIDPDLTIDEVKAILREYAIKLAHSDRDTVVEFGKQGLKKAFS